MQSIFHNAVEQDDEDEEYDEKDVDEKNEHHSRGDRSINRAGRRKDMRVSAAYEETETWTCRYQRNNKHSGLKNLRCFPVCTDQHRLRGFCGRPAILAVRNPQRRSLRTWCEFLKVPSGKEDKDGGVPLGTVMTLSEINTRVRDKDHPERPWMEGELANKDAFDSSEAQATFLFNKQKKGWHYGWQANKHTCESEHFLRGYVFESCGQGSSQEPCFELVAFADSPSFTMFCRRRQRHDLERLPTQIKAQLALQDEIKRNLESGATGAALKQMPRAIPVDATTNAVLKLLDSKEQEDRRHPSSPSKAASLGKRKTGPIGSALLGNKRPRLAKKAPECTARPCPSASDGVQVIPATTYEERRQLLFHVMRALLRIDVKSATPMLATVKSAGLEIYPDNQTSPAGSSYGDPSQAVHDAFAQHSGSSDSTDQSSRGDAESRLAFEAEVMSQLGPSKSHAGLDLPDLDDFEPFDIDFSVLMGDDTTNDVGSLATSANNNHGDDENENAYGNYGSQVSLLPPPPRAQLHFSEIMRDFAVFLIEERFFTATIENTLSSLGFQSSPLQCKNVAVKVLLDLLEKFLARYNVSLDELHHLFKTQVWEKRPTDPAIIQQDQEDEEETAEQIYEQRLQQAAAASALVKLEQRPIVANTANLNPEEKSKALAETSFMDNVSHYTSTVNYVMPGSPTGGGSPGGYGLRTLASVIPSLPTLEDLGSLWTRAKASIVENDRASSDQALVPVIPDDDFRNDLSGTWTRPAETLDVLEGIRESIGVPWVLRKMLRYVESNFTMAHSPGCLEVQSNRKLLSSGFQRYILDGKEHPWVLPPPIPTERPTRNAYYTATLKDGVLRLFLYYSSKKRIVRDTKKSANNDDIIESVVRFQFRNDSKEEWRDKVVARGMAYRQVAKSPQRVGRENDRDDVHGELSWLSNPVDDFALLS